MACQQFVLLGAVAVVVGRFETDREEKHCQPLASSFLPNPDEVLHFLLAAYLVLQETEQIETSVKKNFGEEKTLFEQSNYHLLLIKAEEKKRRQQKQEKSGE